MKSVAIATIAATAFAVKQEVMQQEAIVGMVDPNVYPLEAAQAGMLLWYENVAKPFILEHREAVYAAAMAETEMERGVLLATCDAGTLCREENELVIRQALNIEWAKIMKSFRTDVESTIIKTKEIISAGWENAVICEVDHPCCSVSETVWDNLQLQIATVEDKIDEKTKMFDELDAKRCEIECECPDAHDYAAAYGEGYEPCDCALYEALMN